MSEANKLRANLALKNFDADPDATTETEAGWVDMRDFGSILVGFTRTVGTSALTLRLMANADSAGGGTDVAVKTKTISSEPDAVGDQVWLEVNEGEIKEAARAAGVDEVRYVTAVYSLATATDEGIITYLRGECKRPQEDLTADIVA